MTENKNTTNNYYEKNGGVNMNNNVYERIEDVIMSTEMDEQARKIMMNKLIGLKREKLNILITGATGSGKSSTINALFDMEVSKVGVGVNPETMDIKSYCLGNMILWDSPGLGDGKEADIRHSKNIISKLTEKDGDGKLIIDLVIVILDGSTKDLGTSYELINNVIIPYMGKERNERILVAINQADVAMKGKHWDYEKNAPDEVLKKFLEEKVASVKKRIYDGTGVTTEPIYYCAGFKEEGEMQSKPYNLSKLFYYILKMTPKEKRLVYVDNTNKEPKMWEDSDELKDYKKEISKGFMETITDSISAGSSIGESIGGIFGSGGAFVGKIIGGVVGGIGGVIKGIGSAIGGFFGW